MPTIIPVQSVSWRCAAVAGARAERIASIDLFCGAGGLTLGLAEAGIHVVLGGDTWEPAAATFQANFSGVRFSNADIADLSATDLLQLSGLATPPDLIVGGPPCQGFSSAGARRLDDERNTLVGVFSRLAASVRPRAILFENVEGFLTARSGAHVTELLDPLIEAGYQVVLRKVNVANYGVPQLRKRIIALAMLGCTPEFPAPTHRAFGGPGAHRVGAWGLPASPTVQDALASLPGSGAASVPSDHVVRSPNTLDAERIRALGPGQTMRDLPGHLRHASYERRANRRVSDGMPTERRGGAPAGLRRLRADEPAKAITGAAPRELIHPSEHRPLTLRECARLQTFPDSFLFVGTLSEKAVLIGNAVPPQFARVLGASLCYQLGAAGATTSGTGRLVSFELTAAEGTSPALTAVGLLLAKRYGVLQELPLAI